VSRQRSDVPLLTAVRELHLPGIRIADLARLPDERGAFAELMRADWRELLDSDELVQANMSMTYPGVIRAWHRHLRGQTDYFLVLRGSIKVCAYDDEDGSPTKGHLVEAVMSEARMQVLRVPGRYWHGFKVVGHEPACLIYFVNRLYDYASPDEERRPWDDPKVVPVAINGRRDDPRAGRPWDWFYPPHR
jgi:dTDP-4-dehydrorhamnose 3,5-epimerase